VKGRSGGLKGALGSCFEGYHCAFSACSPYAPLLVCMRCILIRVPFEFELESSSVSVKSWIEYDNSAVNNFQLIKDKYNKNHKKSFSDLKLAQFTTVGQLSFSSYV